MHRIFYTAPVWALLLLAACSTIIDGDSETLTFNSSPSGAHCKLNRNNETVGEVITPGQVTVRKSKDDIDVICTKDGYENSSAHLKSDIAAATFGNAILGGLGGWAIDSARGSDNKYQETNYITLTARTAVGGGTAPDTNATTSSTSR